jgi:hypothetical protein
MAFKFKSGRDFNMSGGLRGGIRVYEGWRGSKVALLFVKINENGIFGKLCSYILTVYSWDNSKGGTNGNLEFKRIKLHLD